MSHLLLVNQIQKLFQQLQRNNPKVNYFIAVVCNQLKQIERLGGLLKLEIKLPGQTRLVVSYVTSGQPAQKHVIVFDFVVLDEQERLFGVFERAGRRLSLSIIKIKRVVAVEIALG